MNQYQSMDNSKQVYYRLIALWVICEAFAGGIMHAAKLPFTGLIVSSLAITCIILIAYYVPTRSAIIKATVIVVVFKLMLSPHSPPTAYVAVFFQGLMGQLLFSNKRFFNLSAIILAVLALVESAIQRILILVVVYGNGLWKAINQFILKLTKETNPTNYSLVIAIGYILIHAVIGIFVGIYAARLARKSVDWKNKYPELVIKRKQSEPAIVTRKYSGRKKIRIVFIFIWLLLLALFIQSYADVKNAIIPTGVVFNILLRSALILLTWYLILSPVSMFLIKKLLHSKQVQHKQEINEVMLLLPDTRYLFKQAFKLSESKKRLARAKLFLKILLINILTEIQTTESKTA